VANPYMPGDHFFGEIRESRHPKRHMHNAHSGPPVGYAVGERATLPELVHGGA
jgi:hypothetical protein